MCSAARVEEHAVSMLKHGPISPTANARRPDVIDAEQPLAQKTLVAS
jgi:hypothetical protein